MVFIKIGKVKKVIRCMYCNKRIEIQNFNQKICKECLKNGKEKRQDKFSELDENID